MQPALQAVDVWVVDSLVVPASLHDVEGRFVHVNAAAERASGRSNAEWRGRHFIDPVPLEARANVEEQFRRAVEHGEPTDFETVFFDADGQLRRTRAQHLPLRRGGEIVGVLILAFDVRQPSLVPRPVERPPRLTPRQREVLELVAAGLSTNEIATKLTLSTETVRNHLRSVLAGLHAAPVLGPLPPQ